MTKTAVFSTANSTAANSPKLNKFWKRLLFILFVLLNIAIIAATAFSEFGDSEEAAALNLIEINWFWMLPALGCFIAAVLIDLYKYVILIRHARRQAAKPAADWKLARQVVFMGKYYDNITPAAIGGQPFQIYYMSKAKLKSGFDAVIPITAMITTQLGFIIVALISFLFLGSQISNVALLSTGLIGLLVYAFFPCAVMIATFFPTPTAAILSLGVKLLATLHFIKDKDTALQAAHNSLMNYARSLRQILARRNLCLTALGLSVLYQILLCAMPFFILLTFGGSLNFLTCFVSVVAISSTIYFVPTPGNAGAAEGSFYLVFSGLTSGYVFWAMLFWRLFNYYSYIGLGALTMLEMYLKKSEKSILAHFKHQQESQ